MVPLGALLMVVREEETVSVLEVGLVQLQEAQEGET